MIALSGFFSFGHLSNGFMTKPCFHLFVLDLSLLAFNLNPFLSQNSGERNHVIWIPFSFCFPAWRCDIHFPVLIWKRGRKVQSIPKQKIIIPIIRYGNFTAISFNFNPRPSPGAVTSLSGSILGMEYILTTHRLHDLWQVHDWEFYPHINQRTQRIGP